MDSFLQQIPTTLYLTALTGFMTASATLIGIFITNKANNDRLALQLSREQNAKQKEIIRTKLEELYLLFKQWNSNISIVYLNRTSVMAGDIDYKSVLEMDKNSGEKNTVDFSRIEMLIDLYFSRLKPDYTKVIEARGIVNKIMLTHQKQYLSGNIDGKSFITPFLNAQDSFDKETDRFIKLIAEQAEEI